MIILITNIEEFEKNLRSIEKFMRNKSNFMQTTVIYKNDELESYYSQTSRAHTINIFSMYDDAEYNCVNLGSFEYNHATIKEFYDYCEGETLKELVFKRAYNELGSISHNLPEHLKNKIIPFSILDDFPELKNSQIQSKFWEYIEEC